MTNWDKTQNMKKRLQAEDKLDSTCGEDLYQGRPIIHRDSPVNGGVYLGEGRREAIVVDFDKHGERLKELYQTAKRRASVNGHVRRDAVLKSVFTTVEEALPIQDEEAVKALCKKLGVENDGKVSLDVFIDAKTGVCRHLALTCAALLEIFKRDGHIAGNPSVDRNSDYAGGHAWCRYTNSGGEVFILDVAQHYLGELNDADKNRWAYKRPEDF